MRRLLRIVGTVIGLLALVIVGYPLAGWIGSSIPESDAVAQRARATDGVEILVETNGTHTSIVVPVVTDAKDWRTSFPSAATPDAHGRVPTHLSIGWGEREVFLHVPHLGRVEGRHRAAHCHCGRRCSDAGEPLCAPHARAKPSSAAHHRCTIRTPCRRDRTTPARLARRTASRSPERHLRRRCLSTRLRAPIRWPTIATAGWATRWPKQA